MIVISLILSVKLHPDHLDVVIKKGFRKHVSLP